MSALLSRLPRELSDCLQRGQDLLRSEDRERRFPTTVAALDELLGGGLARGEMVECIGRRTSGRFSLVLATLAAATQRGEAVTLVDLGDHLDPQVARASGVELERLLWLRPRRMKEALAGSEVVLAGGFPLVIFDLGTPPIPGGRGAEAGWLRLARAAKIQESALLISSPYRASGTAAKAVVELRTVAGRWLGRDRSPRLLQGLCSRVALEKFRGHTPREGESFDLYLATDAHSTRQSG